MHHEGRGHLLLAERPGWRNAVLDRIVATDGMRLAAAPGPPAPLVDESGSIGGLTLPTGIAAAGDGSIWIVDAAAHALARFDPCTGAFEPVACVGGPGGEPRQFRDPRGIAISPRGFLYVCDTGNRRVQVFTVAGLALRAMWRMTPNTWEPFDVAVGRCCEVYVSDPANGLVHVFDARGRRSRVISHERPGVPLTKPTHLATDREGRLVVAQDGDSGVLIFPEGKEPAERINPPSDLGDRFSPSGVAVGPDGTIYIADACSGRLFRCLGQTPRLPVACPPTLGAPVALAFDASGRAVLVNGDNRVLCFEPSIAYEREGRYLCDALDSELRRCRWHRIVLDANVPQGTSIRVETFTADTRKPLEEILDLPDERWQTRTVHAAVGDGEWDCLIRGEPGRYAWIRLTLAGDGDRTPVVRAIRAHYPRTSSIRFLPATYAEDPVGGEFLDRFLSIFDTVLGGTGERIASFAAQLDPGAASTEPQPRDQVDFLTWVASWLDLTLQRHWPERRRRELLRQAHRLYRLRGTLAGLQLHVRLLTGVEPFVLEHFKLRPWAFAGAARAGDGIRVWGDEIVRRLKLEEYSTIGRFRLLEDADPRLDPLSHVANRFTVFVPLPGGGTETERENIRWVVEESKPAHAQATVQFVEPRFSVEPGLVLGMNTMLRTTPTATVAGSSRLRVDAGLGEDGDGTAPATRIGRRARIGISTLVD